MHIRRRYSNMASRGWVRRAGRSIGNKATIVSRIMIWIIALLLLGLIIYSVT